MSFTAVVSPEHTFPQEVMDAYHNFLIAAGSFRVKNRHPEVYGLGQQIAAQSRVETTHTLFVQALRSNKLLIEVGDCWQVIHPFTFRIGCFVYADNYNSNVTPSVQYFCRPDEHLIYGGLLSI